MDCDGSHKKNAQFNKVNKFNKFMISLSTFEDEFRI